MNPIVTVVLETPFVADEEPGGGAVAGDSVEGTFGKGRLPSGVGIVASGDSAGDGEETSGDETGESDRGEGADGGIAGEEAGGEEVASVSISTFIPLLQCPGAAQMKYLFPGDDKVMTVLPSVCN